MRVHRIQDKYGDWYRGIRIGNDFFALHPTIEIYVDDEVEIHSRVYDFVLLKFQPKDRDQITVIAKKLEN